MSYIFYVLGKSGVGKDATLQKLLSNKELNLKRIVPCTTRPRRQNELNGKDYNFVTNDDFIKLKEDHKIIESRSYNTVNGIWNYFTVNDNQINLNNNYITIGTLESFIVVKDFYDLERKYNNLNIHVIPIYIDLDDGERLIRSIIREKSQSNPNYKEICRRFLSDSKDYSKNNLIDANINAIFINDNLEKCTNEIINYIKTYL